METSERDVVGSPTRQYLAALTANLLYISTGCVMAWTSPTFPKLKGLITAEEESWVGSLFSFGGAFGTLIIAFGTDRIGRKGTLYIVASCFIASWIILACFENVYGIYIGRIVGGLGTGGSFSGTPIFIGEIADSQRRGSLGSFNQFFIAIGFLIEYCVGPYSSYLTLILVSSSMAVLFCVFFYIIPESPYYLMAKGKKLQAIDSLSWFRGGLLPHQFQHELHVIEDEINVMPKNRFSGLKTLFFKKGPQKGFMICLYLILMQQLTGFNALVAYTQPIFAMTKMDLSPAICAMIVGLTNLLAGGGTPFLVRRFGLKSIFILSGFGTGLSEGALGLYFCLQDNKYDVSSLNLLPITSFILINVFYCLGMGPLPWIMATEMLPLEVKSSGMALSGIVSSLSSFAVIQCYAVFVKRVGAGIVFFSFCGIMILGSIAGIFLVPNTNGMSLKEIQNYLHSGKRIKVPETIPNGDCGK